MRDFNLLENLIHCRSLESQAGAPLRASPPVPHLSPVEAQPGKATTTAASSTRAVTRWRVRKALPFGAKPTS